MISIRTSYVRRLRWEMLVFGLCENRTLFLIHSLAKIDDNLLEQTQSLSPNEVCRQSRRFTLARSFFHLQRL